MSTKSDVAPAYDGSSDRAEVGYGTGKERLQITPEQEKKLIRKLDRNILPMVMTLYLCSFLDRVNIGNARLYGLEEDLGMTGNDYQLAVSVLFITYLSFEVPSNLVLKKFTPSRWIAFITVAWGIVSTLTGIVTNFPSLLAMRLLLGLFEAGLFPGMTIYLTFFYTRKELALRIGYLFVSAAIAGACGGLLAYAIGFMDGLAGLKGWRWILIIEGIPTVVVGIAAYFFLADEPLTAKYLTQEEREIVAHRLRYQHGAVEAEEKMYKKDVFAALKDWKVWAVAFSQYGLNSMLYSFSTFLPTIINAMGRGWTRAEVQALTIPCYFLGAVTYLTASHFSDKYQQRGIVLIGACLTSMFGYILLMTPTSSSVHYTGCFFVAAGLYVAVGTGFAWNAQNYPRYGKRTLASGLQIALSNSSGVGAPFLYATRDAPRFIKGHAVSMALVGFAVVGFTLLSVYYRRENKKRDSGARDHLLDGKSEAEIAQMGDDSPRYRYVI